MQTVNQKIMKQILVFVWIFLLHPAFSRAQEAAMVVHDAHAELRNTGSFHSVRVSNAITLIVSQGNETAVVVSAADPAFRNRIKTEVHEGVLHISYEGGGALNLNKKNPALRAYVSVQQLRMIEAVGACDVKVNGVLRSEELKINLSGASQFKGEVLATTLQVEQSGASTSKIKGRVTHLTVQVTGASDFNGFDLVADNAKTQAGGASDIRITVNKDLQVYCSGASDVQYRGNAVISDFRSSGASSIRKREQK
jgi:hypothetical protein